MISGYSLLLIIIVQDVHCRSLARGGIFPFEDVEYFTRSAKKRKHLFSGVQHRARQSLRKRPCEYLREKSFWQSNPTDWPTERRLSLSHRDDKSVANVTTCHWRQRANGRSDDGGRPGRQQVGSSEFQSGPVGRRLRGQNVAGAPIHRRQIQRQTR